MYNNNHTNNNSPLVKTCYTSLIQDYLFFDLIKTNDQLNKDKLKRTSLLNHDYEVPEEEAEQQ